MITHNILIPPDIVAQYKLNDLVDQDGLIYMEIIQGIYRLLQTGILANNLLAQHFHNHGYYQVKCIPGSWRHVWRPISFILAVDDFGIGHIGKEHADHLMSVLKMNY